MDQEYKHPQVTQAQLDIWLGDPTTKKYLECLDLAIEDRIRFLGEGDWAGEDVNHNQGVVSTNLGERRGLTIAVFPTELFVACEMLAIPKEEDEDDGA